MQLLALVAALVVVVSADGVSERQVPPCLGCALSQNACLALPCTDPECIQCLTSLSTIPNLSNVTVPASCRANSQACAIMQCVNNACAGVCGVVSCSLATCTPIGGLCTTSTSCCGYTRVNPEPPAKTCGSLESPLLVRCFQNVCTNCQLSQGGSCAGSNTACCDSSMQCARHVSLCDETFPCDDNSKFVLGVPRTSMRCVPNSALRLV